MTSSWVAAANVWLPMGDHFEKLADIFGDIYLQIKEIWAAVFAIVCIMNETAEQEPKPRRSVD